MEYFVGYIQLNIELQQIFKIWYWGHDFWLARLKNRWIWWKYWHTWEIHSSQQLVLINNNKNNKNRENSDIALAIPDRAPQYRGWQGAEKMQLMPSCCGMLSVSWFFTSVPLPDSMYGISLFIRNWKHFMPPCKMIDNGKDVFITWLWKV